MSDALDFQAIKARVSLLDVIRFLKLPMQEKDGVYRGVCPTCQSRSNRNFVVTPNKGAYCWDAKKGGDQIWCVAHIKRCTMREAAQALATAFPPTQEAPQASQETDPLLRVVDHLAFDHEAVDALKLTPEVAEAIGIGFASKGLMRGRVAVPIRSASGRLLGYLGIAENADVKFPSNLRDRIVS